MKKLSITTAKNAKKVIKMLAGALVLVSTILFARDNARYRKLTDEFNSVAVGDTKRGVSLLLGEPNAVFLKVDSFFLSGNFENETWVYGRTYTIRDAFALEPPYFYPLQFRFGPLSDDIVIEFDTDEHVVDANFER